MVGRMKVKGQCWSGSIEGGRYICQGRLTINMFDKFIRLLTCV